MIFNFEKLNVYQKAKAFNHEISKTLRQKRVDRVTHDQLRRAAFSIMLNIAEGADRESDPSKKNFYVIAKGSAYESVAIVEFIKDENQINPHQAEQLRSELVVICKMLYKLIKSLS